MKRIPLLLLLLLTSTLVAAPAFAVGGLNLSSGACWGAGGAGDVTFACNANAGIALNVVASVIVPLPVPQFQGTQATITIHSDLVGFGVPSWWFIQTAGCRANALRANFAPADLAGGCPDIWGGNVPLPITTIDLYPALVRIVSYASLSQDLVQSIDDNDVGATEYDIERITVSAAKSTGVGSCSSCSLGACIVFDELFLWQTPELGGVRVTNAANRNFVTYNRGFSDGTCPGAAVPTRNRTWGAIKSLYR